MDFLSNEKVMISLIAAASALAGALLGSVVSPWIKAKLEDSNKEKVRKRELIAQWRAMLLEIQPKIRHDGDVGKLIQVHPAYLSLEPHLDEDKKMLVYEENRNLVVGSALSAPLHLLKLEISKIEKKWGL